MSNNLQIFDYPMENLKTDEIVRIIADYEKTVIISKPLKILILRNFTIEPIIPYLKYLCYQECIPCKVTVGDYDNILQEIVNSDGILTVNKPDVIIVGIKLEQFNEKFASAFIEMLPEEIASSKNSFLGFVKTIIEEIRKKTNAVILIHNLEVPVYTPFGILDCQKNSMEHNTISDLNKQIIDLISNYKGTYIVDIDNLKSILGYQNFIDNRNWYLTRLPYSQKALRLISREYLRFLNSIKGKTKKCLVLDCDNTLWGGIIGEDGLNNIQLGPSYPGSIFSEFQRSVLNLYKRGILLAVCSKNNENDVMEVFEKHPYMILKKEHFVSIKIDWNDKVTNIKKIAEELNIGIDSLVFIDDNQFEIAQVKQMLPEIEVIHFTRPEGCLYKDILYRSGFFDTLSFSDEDQYRSELYKADKCRTTLKTITKTLEEFFTDLQMEIFIRNAESFSTPRIAQLTQKTNQFNLTTKRYTESQISMFSESPEWSVRHLELKDRFGTNGIVGIAILHFKDNVACIDTFLLSCRVIGRSVEQVLLLDCIEIAKKHECTRIIGQYSPTKKNIQVQSFYSNYGFEMLKEVDGTTCYYKKIDDSIINYPEYFRTIVRE
jgi:FkbH-like protein